MKTNGKHGLLIIWRGYCTEAQRHEREDRIDAAWACLEAAHIVGQRVTSLHIRSHAIMLSLAWRTRDWKEARGQVLRLVASVLITWAWVPLGNSGRARVSAISPAPVPQDLADLISSDDAL